MSQKEDINFVYVIASIEDGMPVAPCKIGITRSLPSRLSSIQTGSPKKLELISAIPIPTRALVKVVEAALHWQFEEFRLAGEWFDINPVDASISSCCMARDVFLETGLGEEDTHRVLSNLGIVTEISRAFEYIEHCKLHGIPLKSRFMDGDTA